MQRWGKSPQNNQRLCARYEISMLPPHLLEEGRGDIDVYFTRVYNPLWVNPDSISGVHCWLQKATSACKAIADERRAIFEGQQISVEAESTSSESEARITSKRKSLVNQCRKLE